MGSFGEGAVESRLSFAASDAVWWAGAEEIGQLLDAMEQE